jgi:hypothetical protein
LVKNIKSFDPRISIVIMVLIDFMDCYAACLNKQFQIEIITYLFLDMHTKTPKIWHN